MSVNALNHAKVNLLDLLPAQPAKARGEAAGPEPSERDSGAGFRDLLRESEGRNSQPAEARSIDKPDNDAPREASQPEQAKAEDSQASDQNEKRSETEGAQNTREDGEAKTKDQSADVSAEQTDEQSQQAEASDVDAQAANAAAQFAIAQQGIQVDSTQAADEQGESESVSLEKQAQAALAQAGNTAGKSGKAQAQGTQTQAAGTSVVQQALQQDAQAQAGTDDSAGDTHAAKQAGPTTAASGNNGNTPATPFALPDQAAAESRMPVNPTANAAQHVDAAKLLQAGTQANANSDNDAINTARITRGLANAVQQRGGAVTLRLTPPEMGTVRIQMQITGTNISASFHAESTSAQSLLTQQLSQLRTALETQGMNVEKLSVQPLASTQASQNANQNHNNDNQQNNQSQQHSANDGRSRGQYSGDSSNGRSSGRDGDAGAQSNGRQAPRGFFDRLTDAAEAA